jgi:hypothetical protein
VEQLCVDRTMITRRTVLDIQMGSEAVVANARPLSNPGLGAYTLGFFAYQLNPHTETAVYVKTTSQAGLDFGGLFGATNISDLGGAVNSWEFGMSSESESDHVTMSASFGGNAAFLGQNYGAGIGVLSSGDSADGDGVLVNTTSSGEHERLSIHADYDMIVDGMTFTSMDLGESVRFFLDGTLVMDATFEGNKASVMEGLQYMALDSLFVAAGSSFAIEHGGIGDGFAISSMILNVVPTPSALSLFGLGGLIAIRRRR